MFVKYQEEICVIQPNEMSDSNFLNLLSKVEYDHISKNKEIEIESFCFSLNELGVEILNKREKFCGREEEDKKNNDNKYKKVSFKTKYFSKSKEISLLNLDIANNELVFSCSLNEYTLEVRFIKGHFKQFIKKNDEEITGPMWLSDVVLNFENRWKDIIYTFNEIENYDIQYEYIRKEETLWILRRDLRFKEQ